MVDMENIRVNDGSMQLEIIGIEMISNNGRKTNFYRIKGYDSLSEINISRRYKEFHLFRDELFSRYPGLYIPPIPSKQATGNKEDNFVQERQYFLDQFLR
jgi:hypothetical protein